MLELCVFYRLEWTLLVHFFYLSFIKNVFFLTSSTLKMCFVTYYCLKFTVWVTHSLISEVLMLKKDHNLQTKQGNQRDHNLMIRPEEGQNSGIIIKYCWRVKVYLNKLRSNLKVGKFVEILLFRSGCSGTYQNNLSICRDEQLV